MKKNLIQIVVIAILLVILLVPSLNPFLDSATKSAVVAQLQEVFGGLFANHGMLTPAKLISAAAIVLIVWLANILICSLLQWIADMKSSSRSIIGLTTSLVKFLSVIVGAVWALGVLGINLTAIFASLGVASLIVGFGAQSLIEDAVTGIFIIFEGQYQVGDIIVLDDFRGTVKHIGIRTTTIEDGGGNQKVVNNSDIRNMQNRSRNSSIAVCDLCISYNADIRNAEKVIQATLPKIYEQYNTLFLAQPRYLGVESLGESSVVLRIVADVAETDFFLGYRTLNRELKLMCDENGIEIPFNQIVVHKADNET